MATRHRAVAGLLLTALLPLAACGDVDEEAEPAAGTEPPALVAGRWNGFGDVQNPAEARLLGCTAGLRTLDGLLAATVGPDCPVLDPPEVVQSGGTFTLLRDPLLCRDGRTRGASGGGSVEGSTVLGTLDLIGETEVRTRHFRGAVEGNRLSLAVERLEVDGLSSGTCLISPPLRMDILILP